MVWLTLVSGVVSTHKTDVSGGAPLENFLDHHLERRCDGRDIHRRNLLSSTTQIYSCQMMLVTPMWAHQVAAMTRDPVCRARLDHRLLKVRHPRSKTVVYDKATGTPQSYMNSKSSQRDIKTYILMHSCLTGSCFRRCRQLSRASYFP